MTKRKNKSKAVRNKKRTALTLSDRKFVNSETKGATKKYKQDFINDYLIFKKTEGTPKAKKLVKIDYQQRENRIKYIKKGKDGRKIWRDLKTGRTITREKVRKIMFESIQTKTILKIQHEKGLSSYDEAEKIFRKETEKRKSRLKNKPIVKTLTDQWKKEGLTKAEIKGRLIQYLQGKAQMQVVQKYYA